MEHLNFNPDNLLSPAKGRLLISEPFLEDPHFKRTVILLCEHNENGSFGFVLNNYVSLKVEALISGLIPFNTKISIGGPVQKNSIFYIHTLGESISGSVHIAEDIYLGGDFEEIKTLINSGVAGTKDIRFFLGYSGWGKEQLSYELKEKSWIVSESTSEQIMDTRNINLWSQSLRAMGKDFAILSNFPTDPNLN